MPTVDGGLSPAMDLAPCGLGSGNSDLLAEAVVLDYLKESSVGEFILGSRRAAPSAP
jgi:oxazoline/thiazoline dehydrogenase